MHFFTPKLSLTPNCNFIFSLNIFFPLEDCTVFFLQSTYFLFSPPLHFVCLSFLHRHGFTVCLSFVAICLSLPSYLTNFFCAPLFFIFILSLVTSLKVLSSEMDQAESRLIR